MGLIISLAAENLEAYFYLPYEDFARGETAYVNLNLNKQAKLTYCAVGGAEGNTGTLASGYDNLLNARWVRKRVRVRQGGNSQGLNTPSYNDSGEVSSGRYILAFKYWQKGVGPSTGFSTRFGATLLYCEQVLS